MDASRLPRRANSSAVTMVESEARTAMMEARTVEMICFMQGEIFIICEGKDVWKQIWGVGVVEDVTEN